MACCSCGMDSSVDSHVGHWLLCASWEVNWKQLPVAKRRRRDVLLKQERLKQIRSLRAKANRLEASL